MNSPELILLRSDEPHHHALEFLLRSHFKLQAVVVESGRAQRQNLFRRGRYRAWFWRVYHTWRRKLMGNSRYRRRFFARSDQEEVAPAATLVVESINDPQIARLLQTCSHDWVIVIGTSILNSAILAASRQRFINLHGGHLPDFRGNHCLFHAYLSGRLDCLAATIHFVDRGVDTGEILAVCPVHEADAPLLAGPEYFYCAAEKRAFGKLIELLQLSRFQTLKGVAQSAGGRTFRTSDRYPHHELLFFFVHARNVCRRLRRCLSK